MTNRLLKFEKEGCNPCKMVQNILDAEGVTVENIDAFEFPELSAKYDIGSVPTLILVDTKGNEISRSIGFKPPEIAELISQM